MKTDRLVKFCTEAQIDEGIKGAKFFSVHRFSDSHEGESNGMAFLDAQRNLIDEFTNRMKHHYGDRVFVSDNLWCSEFMKVEIGKRDVSNGLMVVILQFLKGHKGRYCVILAVYDDLHVKGSEYFGRILVSGRGITVEETLKDFFQNMIESKK
jgi:hypothetical protein